MSIRKIMGVVIDADTLDGEAGATISTSIASDVLRHSNDDIRVTGETSYTKVKEVLLGCPLPSCRLKLALKVSAVDGAGYARVYKNGVAIGTEHSSSSTNLATKTEDFTDWVGGDLIQIYAYHESGTPKTTNVSNMRFYYDEGELTEISGTPLETPLEPLHTNQDP